MGGRAAVSLCDPMDCSLPGSSICWDSPGKNTGVGCHALLQRIFPTQGLNPHLHGAPALQIDYLLLHYQGRRYIGWYGTRHTGLESAQVGPDFGKTIKLASVSLSVMLVNSYLMKSGNHSVVSTVCDPMDCSLPGSPVHRILQARIQEWVAIPFSRGSSQPRDQTQVSHIAGGIFTN